jgi:hypothetical protein
MQFSMSGCLNQKYIFRFFEGADLCFEPCYWATYVCSSPSSTTDISIIDIKWLISMKLGMNNMELETPPSSTF